MVSVSGFHFISIRTININNYDKKSMYIQKEGKESLGLFRLRDKKSASEKTCYETNYLTKYTFYKRKKLQILNAIVIKFKVSL